MASITNANLAITHNHAAKSAKVVVNCKVNFTTYEMNQMKEGLKFRLRCQLWGEDSGLTGADDFLYTIPASKLFPDATPNATESVSFETTVGEGLLDEDFGTDEIYAKLRLTNLYTLITVNKKSNVVTHSF